MCQPNNIANRHFTFQNKTLAAVYGVERDIVRFNSRTKHSPCSYAVHKMLVRDDGLDTVNITGSYPDVYSVLRIEAAASLLEEGQDTDDAFRDLLAEERHLSFDDALAVFRYAQTLEGITDVGSNVRIESFGDILALHHQCEHGFAAEGSNALFDGLSRSAGGVDRMLFPVASRGATERDLLFEDFCTFINTDILSPISQASIAQLQFAALMPFEENFDRVKRLITHYILQKRKLFDGIALPFDLFADRNDHGLQNRYVPYPFSDDHQNDVVLSYAEDSTLLMAQTAHRLLYFTQSLYKLFAALVARWKARLGRVGKDSAVELLLYTLAGSPVMTISQALDLIGKSFSTTSEAFDRLESAGILHPGKSIRRSKTFEATEAIFLYRSLYRRRLEQSSTRAS